MKYEFYVGDYVENKDGEVGYIKKVCHCENCKMRGFYEPYICYKDGTDDYITFSQKDNIDSYFNRIGQYDFTKPEQPKEIERLPSEMEARFELPNGKHMRMKTYQDSNEFVVVSYSRELIDKINELVDAVNTMRKDDKK